MAYTQPGGPSTPGRGYPSLGGPSDSYLHQQRDPSSSGSQMSKSASFSNDSNQLRSSSMRNLGATQSPQAAFGFGGMREASTPKSVRWEDASTSRQPSTPFQSSSSSFTFNQQPNTGAQHLQQQQSNSAHLQQATSSSLALQQPQRGSPQSTFPIQSSVTSLSTPEPSKARLASASSQLTTLQQSRSAFHSPTKAQAIPSASPLAVQKTTPPPVKVMHAVSKESVIASRPAILARLRWNVLALLLSWIGPRIGPVGRIYWIMLDAAFKIFGGVADVHLATALSWLHNAAYLVLAINLIEATIRLNTLSNETSKKSGTNNLTRRKPSLANPPGRIPSASSSTVPSPRAKSNTPRRYAHGSPLRESIFRASASAHGLGEGRRLPSQTPSFDLGRKSSSNASPLASFLARKQERMASGGDAGDLSWDGSDADLSFDTIEVDRALRAFSAGYERELSQSRSVADTETRKNGVVV
ncbi:hypothetical protein CBS101457_004242 [Exobasidium rhododendri]|nr:hypothetical protein CBS101457_004242 [Exobasidium rhododendri]